MFWITVRCLLFALLATGSSISTAQVGKSRYHVLSLSTEEAEQKINALAANGWQVKSTAAIQCAMSASPGQSQKQDCLIVTFEREPARLEHDNSRTTYILDQDLVRFAKFAAAVLAVFLVVGAYLFGFKLESALEKVRSTQQDLKVMQGSLAGAHNDLKAAQLTVTNLKQDVEKVLAQVTADVGEISDRKKEASALLMSMKKLTPDETAKLAEVKGKQPGKFRPGGLGKLWQAGATLRIRFLDGNEDKRQQVRKIAPEWTKYANLGFKFVSAGEAEIRISFKDSGVWSYVGTDALSVSQSEPTMNLGWVDKGTVLQHFGLALGLIKEHQNPKANIPWNKKLIYDEMRGAPNNWSKELVDTNVFRKYSGVDFSDGYRDFDPHSIMMNPFPKGWTGGLSLGGSEDLSESDKALIANLYPHGS